MVQRQSSLSPKPLEFLKKDTRRCKYFWFAPCCSYVEGEGGGEYIFTGNTNSESHFFSFSFIKNKRQIYQ
jgi:hypothetical protein